MDNENVPAPVPIRFDEQILSFAAWVPIGKSNFSLDLQKKQRNLIFQISVDILQNTNFFRAFTASAFVLAIYIQQFWNTLHMRESLEITPIDQAHQFVSPPSGDAIMDFVNEMGYTEALHFVSRMEFTKLIICYLGRKYNINQRFASPFHLAEKDHKLGNLKFVPKGEENEVFGMQIPKELITDNIRNAPYYNAYLEMVAKHDQKIAAEKGGKKKLASKADLSKKPATAKQPKPVSSKQSIPAPAKKPKSPLKIINEDEEVHLEPEPQGEVRDTSSPTNAETGAATDKTNSEGDIEILNIGEEQGEDMADKVNLEENTAKIDEGQAGSDPGKTPEPRPPPKHVLMEEEQGGPNPGQSHVALAGLDPGPCMMTSFPILDPRKPNMETKVKSMVTIPIHQASSSVPPLSTPVVDLTPSKPVSSTVQEPFFAVTTKTTITTTLPLPPPLQQQSFIDHALASSVSALAQVSDIKEILRDRMFDSGSYRSQPERVALYKALEASMDRDNMDEFLEATVKSRKRRRNNQDPPPPLPNSDQGKKKRNDSDASASHQPQAQIPLAWKTTNTRDVLSSSSKQKTASQSEQPVEDVPIPDDVHFSDTEVTDAAHLLKMKPRPDWLKPVYNNP
uniref:Histone deacetylase 14 n=1 Tax=Tanacetum cinerariifolium TaxID=118510 RepID=A0A6L2MGL8_TANCI|nr:histone deacetylase 14 [Tanacetum cinerariifolium]